jgi:phage terminase small subunit
VALNPKRAAFVREYTQDYNATQAAIRAGYSPRSARVTGTRLLADAAIQRELQTMGEEARTNAVMTLSELQEWWSNTVRGQEPEARFQDRQKASELLAKSMGAFIDRTEHSGGFVIEFLDADDDG